MAFKKHRKNTKPPKFVFVLIPFKPEYDDVYKMAIRPACEDCNAYCERVDEQFFHEYIIDRIYNQIAKADLIISDMTGKNANVFYETGYAHALGKRVVLITKTSDDILFDLQQYTHIVYGGSLSSLKEKLTSSIRWHLERVPDPAHDTREMISVYSYSIEIIEGANINIPLHNWSTDSFEFSIGIHNKSTKSINVSEISVNFIVPKYFNASETRSDAHVTRIDDGRILFEPKIAGILHAQGWRGGLMKIATENTFLSKDEILDCTMWIINELGRKEVKFNITFAS